MKTTTTVKIVSMTEETIKAEIGTLEQGINSRKIEWNNSKGEARACPYSAFTHTGKLSVTADVDSELFSLGCAVFQKVESERRKGGDMVSVKAGHSMKLGTANVTVRTVGLKAEKADVACQLAHAQKLLGRLRDLRAELINRAELEKARNEANARAAHVNDVAAFLNGGPVAVLATA